MRYHTADFKNELKKMGRQIDVSILYQVDILQPNTFIEIKQNIYSASLRYDGNILKSVMKELELETSSNIQLNRKIKFKIGVKVGNSYEYMDYGEFVTIKKEKSEDTKKWIITCYDKMVYAMQDYEEITGTYPMTIRSYLGKISERMGLLGSSYIPSFNNYNKTIPRDVYKDLGYTYRDVLDEIAQATGGFITIETIATTPGGVIGDVLAVTYLRDTNDTIDEEYLNSINVQFGEKYGPINTIVLSRSAESDNVYYPDPLPQDPIELKIVDNQIMNFNDRADFLPGIYNALNGLEYYINDFNSKGILYYTLGDYYNVSIGSNTYKCLMLNDEINVTSGIEEIIYTDMPEESVTDYTKADKTDLGLKRAYIIADKQQAEIDLVAERVVPENMVVNSNFATGNYNGWEERMSVITTKEVITNQNKKWLHLVNNDTTTSPGYPGMLQMIEKELIYGKDYYLSFLAYSPNNSKLVIDIQFFNGDTSVGYFGKEFSLTSNITKYDFKVELPNANITKFSIKMQSTRYTAYNYYVTEFKFENNDSASEWVANGADTIKSEIKISPESISLLANETIQMTADNIAINSTNFNVTKDGEISAKSGVIANININENGLYQSESADYNGFGLWKYGYLSSQGNYIIFHAGGNNAHIGYAMFRVYGDGRVFFKDLILEGRDSNNVPVQTLHFSNETDGNGEYWTWLKIKRGYLSIVDETNSNNPFSVLTITPSIKRVTIGNVNNEFTVRLYKGINQYKEGQSLKAGLIVCGRDTTNQVTTDVSGNNVEFYANGTYAGSVSDKRLKKEISNLDDIENLLKVIDDCKIYHFKADNRGGLIGVGIIAQDLLENCKKYDIENIFDYEIIKEIEYKEEDKNKYYVIDYEQYLLMKTEVQQRKIKKQQEEIDELRQEIKNIKEMIKK